jgi:hypothetical protein
VRGALKEGTIVPVCMTTNVFADSCLRPYIEVPCIDSDLLYRGALHRQLFVI